MQEEISLSNIETATKAYSVQRAELVDAVRQLNETIGVAKKAALPRIKRLVVKTKESEAALRDMVSAAPGLFTKPRTVIFHGVKVGWEKGKGKIEFDDAAKVVALIRKHLPDQADVLVSVKEYPNKTGLRELSVADLKRPGCTVEESSDTVIIKPVDSNVDKIVTALLADQAETEEV
jgi:hypothetical protein